MSEMGLEMNEVIERTGKDGVVGGTVWGDE